MKLYNSVLRGYLNYYSFTHNYSRVASSLEFILKTSCAKLLAAKFKLGSVTEVLARYGKDLRGDDLIGFHKPSYKLNVWGLKKTPRVISRRQDLNASLSELNPLRPGTGDLSAGAARPVGEASPSGGGGKIERPRKISSVHNGCYILG